MITHPLATINQKVAFLDLETTGLDARHNRIIEVGLVLLSGNTVTKHQWFVDPGEHLPPEIVRFTGITENDLASAPSFRDIANELHELISDALIVAHNARFDVGFLTESFARVGITFRPKQLCTVALSRALIPNLTRANLDAVLAALSIPSHDRHRALPDAEAVYDVITALSALPTFVEVTEHLVRGKLSVPPGLSEQIFQSLPQSPGVYLFLNSENTVLYVGKANNIRTRVRSHFSGVLTGSDARMWKEISQISFEQTSGEIEALLRESQLVKELSPIHNKQLRRNSAMQAVLFESGIVTVKQVHEISVEEIQQIIGVFRSVTQAKERLWELSREYRLCPKRLGLTHEKGACFNSQIGLCEGVCAGVESESSFSNRLATAVSLIRVPIWPYPDQVVILKEKKESEDPVSHIIFNWCYMGVVKGEVSEVLPLKFDWDMYKIVRKALEFPKKWRVTLTHVPLSEFSAAI